MAADKASKRRGRKARAGKARGTGRAAAARKSSAAEAPQEKLYTLTEVGRMASVSMPTLQKYKRLYQDRIPAIGKGRKQRYPREAVAVLRQLKKENLAKRGRPPKSQAGAAAKRRQGTRASAAKDPSSLLTLSEISRRTKISYPTVSRYVKVFIDRIPHVGSGRKRRFPPEAVAAFRQLRSESRPGRPAKATTAKPAKTAATGARRSGAADRALTTRLRKLEKAQAGLAKEVAGLARLVRKPLRLTLER